MRRELWIAILLSAGVLAVYGQTLGFGFVNWDDPAYVTDNPIVQRGLTLEGFVWALRTGESGNWHPLTWLSHMLDVELFGPTPAGTTRRTSRCTCSTRCCCSACCARQPAPSGAARSWPRSSRCTRCTSSPWPGSSERKDVLSTAFGLLAIGAYVGYVRRGGRRPLPARGAALRARA